MLIDEDEALLGELQPKVRFEIVNSAPERPSHGPRERMHSDRRAGWCGSTHALRSRAPLVPAVIPVPRRVWSRSH